MKKRANHNNFFLYHLYDEVQQRYGLTDDEMEKLVSFIKKFHGQNAGKALRNIRKKENKKALEQIVQEVAGRELNMDSVKDIKFDPVTTRDTLVFPMSLPLSKDMLIEPNYYGGYGHAAQ